MIWVMIKFREKRNLARFDKIFYEINPINFYVALKSRNDVEFLEHPIFYRLDR